MKTNSSTLKTLCSAGLIGLALSAVQPAQASIVVGATRVIFNQHDREASVPIKNVDTKSFVVQSWVEAEKQGVKAPFFITPPLVRLDPGKQNMLRILHSHQDLPADRESKFRLNVKEIPEAADEPNVLQIAVRTRIKLFYRPAGLQGLPMDAPRQLQWQVIPNATGKGDVLKVHNPTPYYVTFAHIKAGNENVPDLEDVAPFADSIQPLKQHAPASEPISFATINDFGATIEQDVAHAAP
ncbi:fimbrial biogenesis chaperone [Andreprevotia chitinilytica]|uniref:fimbrial biogenesis chaperone n=1 Tax=Andreprevotia chitinilytica TaxID=396808 RepID=UPI00068AA682|nr:molecular chaperone [Andreprevotia chitinilytica]